MNDLHDHQLHLSMISVTRRWKGIICTSGWSSRMDCCIAVGEIWREPIVAFRGAAVAPLAQVPQRAALELQQEQQSQSIVAEPEGNFAISNNNNGRLDIGLNQKWNCIGPEVVSAISWLILRSFNWETLVSWVQPPAQTLTRQLALTSEDPSYKPRP